MMDDKKSADIKVLRGHNGPVYSVSFSPDRNLLLSASEDSTSKYETNDIFSSLLTLYLLQQFDSGVYRPGLTYVFIKAIAFPCGM